MTGVGPPFDVPAAFGRYRVLHSIGTGRLGPAFRGDDPDTLAPVVIKVVLLNLSTDEAQLVADSLDGLLARLPASAASAPLLAAGLHDGHPYLVSGWVPGQPLDRALREFGTAILEDALPRLRTLASVLDLAAESWSWHGDLHPGNILIDQTRTTITGLGIAPIVERVRPGVSTRPPYTAPEVAAGEATSPLADQYALAAIAFEWIYGTRAPGPTTGLLDVPPLHGTDRTALARAFTRALAAEPESRFESCAAFVAAIESARYTMEAPRIHGVEPLPFGTLPLLDVDDLQANVSPDDAREHAAGDLAAEMTLHLGDPVAPRQELDLDLAALDDLAADLHADFRSDPEPGPPTPEPAPVVEAVPGPTPVASHEQADDEDVPPPASKPPLASSTLQARPPLLLEDDDLPPPPRHLGTLPAEDEPLAFAAEAEPTHGYGRVALVIALVVGLLIGAVFGFALARRGMVSAPAAVELAAPAPDVPAESAAATVPPAAADDRPAPASLSNEANRNDVQRADAPGPAATPSGQLLVRSTPTGAQVTVDGRPRGVTPMSVRDLAIGVHTVTLASPGYRRTEQKVDLSTAQPSRSLDVRLTAERAAATPGLPAAARGQTARGDAALIVDSRPTGARVSIDGQPRGQTPVTLDAVATGTHVVRLERDGYAPWVTSVTVDAGARTRVAASLEPLQ